MLTYATKEFDLHRQFHADRQLALQSQGISDRMGYNNGKPTTSQRVILRGAEILSLLEGKPLNGTYHSSVETGMPC